LLAAAPELADDPQVAERSAIESVNATSRLAAGIYR
jgi:hypothetical protein